MISGKGFRVEQLSEICEKAGLIQAFSDGYEMNA
jgi:hypothetical protein